LKELEELEEQGGRGERGEGRGLVRSSGGIQGDPRKLSSFKGLLSLWGKEVLLYIGNDIIAPSDPAKQ
jgi:hypothetical protein